MIRNPYASLLFLLLATPMGLQAQRAFGGQPYGNKAEKRSMPPAMAVHLPAVDVAALLAEDAARAAQGIKGPYRFGFTHTTAFDLSNSGAWTTMPNGDRVWRLLLHCPGAVAINLVLSDFDVPEGARVFLYNAAGEVRGAYTAASSPGHRMLGTTPLPGDRLTVEYIEPPAVAGQGHLTIGQVVHDYRDLAKSADREFGASGPCNVNTVCPEGDAWRNEIRSVAHLIIGNGVCSGTLLNNCANDSTPYFLTANHCTEGNTAYGSWVFVFNWESPVCDPTENAPMDHSITGCDMLLENPPTDMAFVRLSSIPPETFTPFWSGWDNTGAAPDSVTCIHHPSGDIKKISGAWGTFDQQDGVDMGNGPADCWHVPAWGYGTTEPGSSGSGLWNKDHHLIGQLYGGEADCNNSVNDYFGRFDLSYPLLSEWLGECGGTLDGYDPYAIVPMPQDAAITSIMDVGVNLCNVDSVRPTVTLKNNGGDDLLSVNVNYLVDGTLVGTLPWTGVLHALQTANVLLPWIHLASGEHELEVRTTAPNGQADDDVTNDADTVRFLVSMPGETLTLDLQLDHYGTETTWDVRTSSGLVIYSGGPYADDPEGQLITREFCLAHDCFTFTIADAVGDGICCDYGEGFYTISDGADNLYLERDGSFGESRSDEFCVTWVGVAENSARAALEVLPNPSTGRFLVRLPAADQADLLVTDALGRPVWHQRAPATAGSGLTIDLEGVSAGTYLLIATIDGTRSAQRFMVQR